MQRKHLAATVAAGPLMALAFGAAPLTVRAEVQITTSTTAPVATATAAAGGADNITVTAAGSITPTTAGPIITLNSNNTVTVLGTLSTSNVSNSTGVLVQGGNTGAVTITAGVNLVSSLTPPDNDGDGDADGPLADGANRYGLRVIGPGAFTGNLTVNSGGSLLVSGNDSAGMSVETAVIGALRHSGTINATGDRAYGIHLTGPLTGSARIDGATSAFGVNAVAVGLDADISGSAILQGAVTSSGYRYTTRPQLSTDRAKLDADDLLQGGPAVRVSGNVGGGVLFDAPPTLAANDDGTFDTDGDGTVDSLEGTSSVTSFGSAPAVLIGSATGATTLGVAGTGSNAFGLINRGEITADGLFDGVSATAVQLGGGAGFGVGIANGFSNSGAITANAYEAKATAINILAGVSAPSIVNSGVITGASTSSVATSASGLVINAGASVSRITNSGTISAEATGPKIDVTAIADLAGGVTRIDNTGQITAAIVNNSTTPTTGRGIAIDARANTAGLAIVQTGVASTTVTIDTDGDGVNDNAEPNIYGDVLFGSGADRLDLTNGSLAGAMAFGAGADVLAISGGATAIGALTDGDGKLDISLAKGTLAIQNAATINATSLNVSSADSQLLFSADPTNGAATKLVVGSATLANNAQIGITLSSVLDTSTRYTVIQAGTLSVGAVRASLTGSPYLYVSSASSNAALGQVYVDVRPRTATELGFNATQAGAFGAIIQALKTDSALAAPLLSQTGRDGLVHLYDQLLPDLGGGTFDALAYSAEQIAQGISQRPDPYDRYGPDSFWAQEVNTLVRTETTDTMGSDTQVFGFAGGYEAMGEFGGALGVAVAYLNTQERDNAAQVGERTTSSVLQGDLYWRRSVGGLRLTLGGGGGYGWMNGQRRFFSGDMNGDGVNDLERDNSAKWNGLLGHAFTSVAYEQGFGRFYARPEGRLDYLYLREGRRRETGGGSGFDLTTEERTSSALNALAALTFGASFGRELWWRPEVRIGYRKQIAGSMGDTVAQFTGGSAFTLPGAENKDGAVTLDVALRAGTPMSYVAVEGGVAAAKKQKRYNLRLAGRMMF